MEMPAADDAQAIYDLVGGTDRDEICSFLVWDGPDSIDEVADWIERCRTAAFDDFGYHWVIRSADPSIADPGTVLGAIGTRPHGSPGRADVGYWLGKAHWGQGIMNEALNAVLDLGFGTLDYGKVEAEVFAHNARGRRLVERVGFQQEGLIRRSLRKRGGWVDEAIYGILAEEWPTANS
jgi:[ribosomal protein S5]-alanine N-acetyltransferase